MLEDRLPAIFPNRLPVAQQGRGQGGERGCRRPKILRWNLTIYLFAQIKPQFFGGGRFAPLPQRNDS